MIERKIDILNLEWLSSGRDREMVIPVLYYCEKVLGLSTFCASIFDGYYWLDKLNPRLLFITNSSGAKINFNIVKYAAKRNIPILTLISEGDLKEDKIDGMIWGWNEDRIMYEDLNLQWNERNRKLILKYYPELSDKLRVSGGVGFDRYKIYDFMTKEHFTDKYKKDYKKIMGIAGWGFDKFLSGYFERLKKDLANSKKEQIKNFREERERVNNILEKLIQNNKDVLFILKYHPGCVHKEFSEFVGLNKYDNVIEIQREESIADCINVSDLWIAYDSTTALEAWLLGKQTFLINPTIIDFTRSDISKGLPIFKNYRECQRAIDDFYKTGKLTGFEEKLGIRKEIIKTTIGWDDGKNHIIVGKAIKELLEKTKDRKIRKPPFKTYLRHYIKHILFEKTRYLTKYSFINKIPSPKLRWLKHRHDIFSYEELEELRRKYHRYLDRFYEENINKSDIFSDSNKIKI